VARVRSSRQCVALPGGVFGSRDLRVALFIILVGAP
jgi:hypothetical protein